MANRKGTRLTKKQTAFCLEFVKTDRVSDAYRTAYGLPQAPLAAVSVRAARLLNLAKIEAECKRLRSAGAKQAGITVARVMQEYARIALADVRRAFGADGRLKPLAEIDDDTAAALAGIETIETEEGCKLHKIKMVDKRGALDSLAKTMGMFQEAAPAGSATQINLVVMQAGAEMPEQIEGPRPAGAQVVDIKALIQE